MEIRKVGYKEKDVIKKVVDIHIKTFKGFFLTFMGRRFLKLMYSCYTRFSKAGLIVAIEKDDVLGFLAYSEDMSGLYRYMIKHGFFAFVWFAFLAFLRRPKTFFRLFAALKKPKDAEREEKYVELASIGVDPDKKRGGVGSALISALKAMVDFNEFSYIALETDAANNDAANAFYVKNGFTVAKTFVKNGDRPMNEYRYRNEDTRS